MKTVLKQFTALMSVLTTALFPLSVVHATNYTTLYPTADISTTNWIASSGSDHYSLVDDPANCDDSTYVYTRAVDNYVEEFDYDLSAIPNGAYIFSIDLYPCVGVFGSEHSASSTFYLFPKLNGIQEWSGQWISFTSGESPLTEYGPFVFESWDSSLNTKFPIQKDGNTKISAAHFYVRDPNSQEPPTVKLSRARMVISWWAP